MAELTDIGRSLANVMTEAETKQRFAQLKAMWRSAGRQQVDLTRSHVEEITDEFMLHGPFDTISFWRDHNGLRWKMSNSGYSSNATDRRTQALTDMANGIITPAECRSIMRGVTTINRDNRRSLDNFDNGLRRFADATEDLSAITQPKPWRPPSKPPHSRLGKMWRRITWTLAGA